MSTPRLAFFAGYSGVHSRDEAPGAYRNGTRVKKVVMEAGDRHQLGEQATVLGSIQVDGQIGYFVEWDTLRKKAVFVLAWKVRPVPEDEA